MKTIFRPILIVALIAGACSTAALAADKPSTPAEKRAARECMRQPETLEGSVFTYPLKTFAAPDADVMAVNVDAEKWKALSHAERVSLMGDLACAYAGGHLDKKFWQPFGAIDAKMNKTVETFTVDEMYAAAAKALNGRR